MTIVLLGATGYQGALTARALAARGLAPLLAGRNGKRLAARAAELGGLPHAQIDLTDGASLRRLLQKGDVLVSTAGPFCLHGAPQVEAAIAAGAHYIDSCGEPPYYRTLYERYRAPAHAAGSALLTACAYDFFPGNLIADHVLQRAGGGAVRLELGYFGNLAPGYRASSGSQASGLVTMLEPGLFLRGGRLVAEPLGQRLGAARLDGELRPGLSIAGTEHLFLPELYPELRDIDSYWGWAGGATNAVHHVLRACAALARSTRAKRALSSLLARAARSDGSGPDANLRERSSAYVTAAAYDAHGCTLAAAQIGDIDGFSFTANIMAWTAAAVARGELRATGVIGPVQAFGRAALRSGHAEAGFAIEDLQPELPQARAQRAEGAEPALSPS